MKTLAQIRDDLASAYDRAVDCARKYPDAERYPLMVGYLGAACERAAREIDALPKPRARARRFR